jgi:hypothetical protein
LSARPHCCVTPCPQTKCSTSRTRLLCKGVQQRQGAKAQCLQRSCHISSPAPLVCQQPHVSSNLGVHGKHVFIVASSTVIVVVSAVVIISVAPGNQLPSVNASLGVISTFGALVCSTALLLGGWAALVNIGTARLAHKFGALRLTPHIQTTIVVRPATVGATNLQLNLLDAGAGGANTWCQNSDPMLV